MPLTQAELVAAVSLSPAKESLLSQPDSEYIKQFPLPRQLPFPLATCPLVSFICHPPAWPSQFCPPVLKTYNGISGKFDGFSFH